MTRFQILYSPKPNPNPSLAIQNHKLEIHSSRASNIAFLLDIAQMSDLDFVPENLGSSHHMFVVRVGMLVATSEKRVLWAAVSSSSIGPRSKHFSRARQNSRRGKQRRR